MTDGFGGCGGSWFLRKIRPTQLWVELGCGNLFSVPNTQYVLCNAHSVSASPSVSDPIPIGCHN